MLHRCFFRTLRQGFGKLSPVAQGSAFALLSILLAGCAAERSSAPRTLPPPQVRVTHAAAPEPSAAPSPFPTPSSSLQAIAVQTYGSRLIQRIAIPAIGVSSPVVAVGWQVERTPDFQAGTSA